MSGVGATGNNDIVDTKCMPNFEPACYAFGKSDGKEKPPIYVQVGKNKPIKITYNDDTIDKAAEISEENIEEMNNEIAAAKAEAEGEGEEGGARRKRRSNKRKPKKSAKKPKRSKKGKTRKQKK